LDIQFNDPASVGQAIDAWTGTLVDSAVYLGLPILLALLLLLLAGLVFLIYPSWIRYQKRLRPFGRQEDSRFYDAVRNLAHETGVSPPPSIEVGESAQAADGQVFGLPGRYAIRLGKGLRLVLRKNPGGFRGIVLHELAHLANRDVWRTFFAQSIWIAAVVLILFPTILFVLVSFSGAFLGKFADGFSSRDLKVLLGENLPSALLFLFQVFCIMAIIFMMRASLLRVREVYADWRAAQWGVEADLARILEHHAAQEKPISRWRMLWKLHPPAMERLAMLRIPNNLFHIHGELPFLGGAVLAFLLPGSTILALGGGLLITSITAILPLLFIDTANPLAILQIALLTLDTGFILLLLAVAAAFLYLIAGSLGLQVQREAVADVVTGQRGFLSYLHMWKPAVLSAIGFQIGNQVIPYNPVLLIPDMTVNARLLTLLVLVLQTLYVALFAWLWLSYIRFFAIRTLGAHASARPPQGARRLLTAAASVLLLFGSPPVLVMNLIMNEFGSQTVSLIEFDFTFWSITLGITLAAAVGLFAVQLVSSGILLGLRKLLGRPKCPTCRWETGQSNAAGRRCVRCGNELATWLLLPAPPAIPDPEAVKPIILLPAADAENPLVSPL
jgi:Zn-dependent protease with chaperone function